MNYGKFVFCVCAVLMTAAVFAADNNAVATPSPGLRYATDAYPGFDNEDEIVRPSKKAKRWFQFFTGPKMQTAAEQFAWAAQCEANQSWSKARRAYDAVVRNWPTSSEAPKAQAKVAEIYLVHDQDFDEAFAEYRYLADFYSLQCDYNAVLQKLYQIATLMKDEGKRIFFCRFDNTVDTRRAFEAVVLRSPGAAYAPAAMLTIARLREDEGKFGHAVTVYENLRNLYGGTAEAAKALHEEARVRMAILEEHGYNRQRTLDTVSFLKLALKQPNDEAVDRDLRQWLDRAEALLEEEAWKSAKFYDSRTRTLRSAINAYEQFLLGYPRGVHAEEAKARLEELKSPPKAAAPAEETQPEEEKENE